MTSNSTEAANSDTQSSIGNRRKHARSESRPGYAEKRQRLLAGAADVFKEKGLQAASINDIAERFGGDRASIYYYYGSKHEIFIDLIQQAVEEVVLQAEKVARSRQPADVRLTRILESTLGLFEHHYPYMFVYIQEDMRKVPGDGTAAGEELRSLGVRFERALEKIVRDGVRSGVFRAEINAKMLMFAVSGAMNWSHRWFNPEGHLPGAAVGTAFADFFLNGVLERKRPRRASIRPATSA